MKSLSFAFAAALVALSLVGASAASQKADPLVGTWKGDVKISISASASGYDAKFAGDQLYGDCTVHNGDVIFTLAPLGAGFYNQQVTVYAKSNGCKGSNDFPPSKIKVDVSGQTLLIRCESDPSTTCSSYIRVGGKDTQRPYVKALNSSGRASATKITRLLHKISDDSDRAKLLLTIYRGSKLVDRGSTRLQFVGHDKTALEYLAYFPRASMKKGLYRWCLQAEDGAGNKSAKSCARLVLK